MAFDAATSSVLLFGGIGSLDNFGDTWAWTGGGWAQLSPTVSPNPLYNTAMAYDAANGTVVMFGGQDSNAQWVDSTWIWNGSTWAQVSPATSPAPRGKPHLVFDAAHGTTILFGGCCTADGQPFDDTWAWDGSTWTQQHPGTSPPGSNSASIAYDAARQQVVLFGGCCGRSDTWTWDGQTWTRHATNGGPKIGGVMADDAAHGVVVLAQSDGTTWTWNGSSWIEQASATAPRARNQAAMAYDAASQTMVLFGGAADGYPRNDTWTKDGSGWLEVNSSSGPQPPVLNLATDVVSG